ncbi:MAG: hypothetical protein KDD61_05215, partial [Bdellovibrionales bacterium]|nr:hypothetical protein [Bdellovibrionales bacterium]
MAELFWDKDCSTRDREEIQSILKKLDVQLSYWAVADGADAQDLLGQDILSDDQKEQLLEYHDHYFSRLRNEQGYQSRDLIVLHKNLEGLDGLLQKFNRCHTHDDDEVRYIIDGSGIFGFVLPNGEQVKLKVEAGEF